MEKNKSFNDYSTGYDPDAVEHDLQAISLLTHGRKKLTARQAQEIYYIIKNENIRFRSEKGEDFMLGLYENMTDEQVQKINNAIRRKRQRKQDRRQLLGLNRKIAAWVSAAVLALSALCINWSLLMDLRTDYKAKKLQAKVMVTGNILISDEKVALAPVESVAEPPTDENEASASGEREILPKFAWLYSENQDFAGWLRVPGTKIDYPVMSREGDNNYYLDKNFEQKYDKNGLLILDYRSGIKNSAENAGQNLIIYGHNMRTGVMFGTLKYYKDRSFCDGHMTISFDTVYEEREYRVVAAMLAGVAYEDEDVFRYYDAIDISTEENFNEFKENIISNAIYTTGETMEYGDTFLILSTCDSYKEDGRFVVIAKKCVANNGR